MLIIPSLKVSIVFINLISTTKTLSSLAQTKNSSFCEIKGPEPK